MNRTQQLTELLNQKTVHSSRAEYLCEEANEDFVLFAESETTGRIMIPTDLVLEWIHAYEFGEIALQDQPRTMREKITARSRWAAYQHGFETHLSAILRAWAEKYPRRLRSGRSSWSAARSPRLRKLL